MTHATDNIGIGTTWNYHPVLTPRRPVQECEHASTSQSVIQTEGRIIWKSTTFEIHKMLYFFYNIHNLAPSVISAPAGEMTGISINISTIEIF